MEEENKANPQLEDGHTRTANELLEALGRTPLSDYENRIIRCVKRYTYGWNRKYAPISISQFVDFTGILKPHICRTLLRLEKRNIVAYIGNGNDKKYYIIKDYYSWETLPKQVTHNNKTNNKITIIKDISPTPLNEIITYWNSKTELPKISKLTKQRITHLKERLKETVFVSKYKEIIDLISQSDFLSGRKPSESHPNFKGDFDWIIKNDNNYTKVIEGKYKNKSDFQSDIKKNILPKTIDEMMRESREKQMDKDRKHNVPKKENIVMEIINQIGGKQNV